MYNRYIPQSDGSYRRSRLPDPAQPPRTARTAPPSHPPLPKDPPEKAQAHEKPQPPCPCPPAKPQPSAKPRRPQKPAPEPSGEHGGCSAGSFLRNLLPQDFDTGDLLIVMLLLLMAGDHPENSNTALLTLMLYLFL